MVDRARGRECSEHSKERQARDGCTSAIAHDTVPSAAAVIRTHRPIASSLRDENL